MHMSILSLCVYYDLYGENITGSLWKCLLDPDDDSFAKKFSKIIFLARINHAEAFGGRYLGSCLQSVAKLIKHFTMVIFDAGVVININSQSGTTLEL